MTFCRFFIQTSERADSSFKLLCKEQEHSGFDWLFLYPSAGSVGNKPIAFMLLKLGPPSQWHVLNYIPFLWASTYRPNKCKMDYVKKLWSFGIWVRIHVYVYTTWKTKRTHTFFKLCLFMAPWENLQNNVFIKAIIKRRTWKENLHLFM